MGLVDLIAPGRRGERLRTKSFFKFARLGDRARDEGNWVVAAFYYEHALQCEPGRAAYWVQYGHALKEGGEFDRAESAYRRALELDPRGADNHLQLAHLLRRCGRHAEAINGYRMAAALASESEDIRRELADCAREAEAASPVPEAGGEPASRAPAPEVDLPAAAVY